MWQVVGVVTVVVLAATYLTAVANRVDRLHVRAAAAAMALGAASTRRAQAAAEFGQLARLPSVQLAAKAVLSAGGEQWGRDSLAELPRSHRALRDERHGPVGLGDEDVVPAENDLTRALRAVDKTTDANGEDEAANLAWSRVVEASRHLALARQVHTDLVRDALAVRRRRVVRLMRLARRFSQPGFFDIDEPTLDEPPMRPAQ